MHPTLLGGYSPAVFLRRFWQKKPLLVRGAIGGFAGLITKEQLFELARRDDCESRLVVRQRGRWHVEHGPLPYRMQRSLPDAGWTLLVQGIDHFLPRARDLLAQFSFVPHARLDDLMVSYAPPGGGVGPHFDSYDVFLLQGPGRRRWRIGRQHDLTLVDDAPLKILKHFHPQGDADLAAGDMLYLPPEYAHEGIALTECFTYSIGFRAPRFEVMKQAFLADLDDSLTLHGIYRDRDLRPQKHPGTIDPDMMNRLTAQLSRIRWDHARARDFVGRFLTEPKAQVHFSPPAAPLGAAAFARAAARRGINLALPSLMLMYRDKIFINGESYRLPSALRASIRRLADDRGLEPGSSMPQGALRNLLYRWYRDGYIELG